MAPEATSVFPSSVRIPALNSNVNGGGFASEGYVFYLSDHRQSPVTTAEPTPCSPSKLCFSRIKIPDSSRPLASESYKSAAEGVSSASEDVSSVRITWHDSGGPAFLGNVFSVRDRHSGNDLRIPEWLKNIFFKEDPVFRFFVDMGDAESYVSRLAMQNRALAVYRLDLAYELFKEKPHLYQFVPNEKQIKEANKLLKRMPQSSERKRIEGVPVFGAQNLDVVIATTDGIKWFTPYFFDKRILDHILEEHVDQHFQDLIQIRYVQRHQEVAEEMEDIIWESPEDDKLMDEIEHLLKPHDLFKAAENHLLDGVDKLVLGNRWLRKALGIQPGFPYMVDSFEKRSSASFPPPKPNHQKEGSSKEYTKQNKQPNKFLPKITLTYTPTEDDDAEQNSKASLEEVLEDLAQELEHLGQVHVNGWVNEFRAEERDPLFMGNLVGEGNN